MHRREATAWHHMTLQYRLFDAWRLDSFRKMSKKEYTYDNGRSRARSAMSRIDKFLVSQDIDERGSRIEATAFVRKLSDHSPLIITVWGHHPPPHNPPRFFDASLLNMEKCKREMLEAWTRDSSRSNNNRNWLT
ncbi:unnamed protein product [Sphagnum tenellum]